MKTYVLNEVEHARADGAVLRAFRALVRAINDLASRTETGGGTLVAGVSEITVPGLQTGTRIVAGYAVPGGTTGTLYADPSEYDVDAGTAVVRSTSGTDTSGFSWVAVTGG